MISILIPVYNGIEFIQESVQSVLLQTYKHWELIIGVNGHAPNSDVYRIAKTFESIDTRIKVYDLYAIKGKSNALNEMLHYCKYDHVALLDVDDVWQEDKLEIQSKFIQYYDVVGSNCVLFGVREGIVPKIPVHDISRFNFAEVNPVINSSSIIRKELCKWNATYDGVEDYDMWLRLWKSNKTFYNCPEVLVKHRIHPQSAFNAKGNHHLVQPLLIAHGLIREKQSMQKISMQFL